MELQIHKRTSDKKSQIKGARRSGLIPAVIYKKDSEGEMVAIEQTSFAAFLRQLKPGYLPTTQLTLVSDGKKRKVIIKEVQYHPTTYSPLHLDFLELTSAPITVKVPIELVGVAECAGVKQGGILRQVIRYTRVRCLPKDMPEGFAIDVKDLAMGQVRRLRDIELPKGVRALDKLDEVVVVIAKR